MTLKINSGSDNGTRYSHYTIVRMDHRGLPIGGILVPANAVYTVLSVHRNKISIVVLRMMRLSVLTYVVIL